jgi:type IV secretory pathway TraG/TraD family ATPase VirD4
LIRLRQIGGRCVLGFQSASQVSATYGKGIADTIAENCVNTVILRCSANEQGRTSQYRRDHTIRRHYLSGIDQLAVGSLSE